MKNLSTSSLRYILIVTFFFVVLIGAVLYFASESVKCNSTTPEESYRSVRTSRKKQRPKVRPNYPVKEKFDMDHRAYVQDKDPIMKNYNIVQSELSDIIPPNLSYTENDTLSNRQHQYADRVQTLVQSNTNDAIHNAGDVRLPSYSQYLPNEMPEVLDPSIVHYQNNLPVVELKNRQALAADPFRGDIPIRFYPDVSVVGKSRFDRDALRLDGYFSPGSDAKIHKLGNMKTRLP